MTSRVSISTSSAGWVWLGLLVGCTEPPSVLDGGEGDLANTEVHAGLTEVACFGHAPFTICLPAEPTALRLIASTTTTTINTDSSPLCEPVVSGGSVCVLAGSVITIRSKLRATGTRPLVLIATRSIISSALIDVGSHRDEDPETGAGSNPPICATMAGTPPDSERGGAGGSFVGRGGFGGFGGEPGGTVPGTTLRGGCTGQAADSADGVGGHGGGAVLLIAGSSLHIDGDINAAGEGGGPGIGATWSGGAGGGAGGMIVFDAPIIEVTSLVLANGGGGGEGSGAGDGNPGADPSGIAPAAGGSGGSFAGDGGNGAAGVAAGTGADGLTGSGRDGGGGTGGGGGGAGVIKAPAHATLGTRVSPPRTL
jgi:hypothetical protein